MLEFEFRLYLRKFRVRNLLLKKKKKKNEKKNFGFSCAAFVSCKCCCFTVLKFQSKFVLL